MNYFASPAEKRVRIVALALIVLVGLWLVLYFTVWDRFAVLSLSLNTNYPTVAKICGCDPASIKRKDTVEVLRPFVATDTLKRNAMASILAKRLAFLKDGADDGKTVIGWCLAVLGGYILVIISSSYLHPKFPGSRFVYLLFLPAWIFLGLTLNCARNIIGYYAGEELRADGISKVSVLFMNCLGWYQYKYLFISLGFFGVWLITILLLWVYGKMEA